MATALVNYSWDVPETSLLAKDAGTMPVSLNYGRSKGLDDETTARKVIAVKRTGIPGDYHFVVIHSIVVNEDDENPYADASDRVRREIVRMLGADNLPASLKFENTGGGCMALVLERGTTVLVIGQDDYDVYEYSREAWSGESDEQPDAPFAQPTTAAEAARLFVALA